jgi:pimeloyl-ACP methyl ester carboxylesterase
MVRLSFDVAAGKRMEYEFLTPPGYDSAVPIPVLVSISGTGQQHVNRFSQRLSSHGGWAVAVPLRPADAPLFFQGSGSEGDGLWYLRAFCHHLMEKFLVDSGRFIFVGVSNGGNAVLRFAIHFPELCRGLVVVTTGVNGRGEDLRRLQGIPLDLYVGSKDECGFFPPMTELEASLRSLQHYPPASLTIFEGAGHVCSQFVDQSLIVAKISLMLLRSGPLGRTVRLTPPEEAGVLAVEDISARLRAFCDELGLEYGVDSTGTLVATRATAMENASQFAKPASKPNVYSVKVGRPRAHRANTYHPGAAGKSLTSPEKSTATQPQSTGLAGADKSSPPVLPINVRTPRSRPTESHLTPRTACSGISGGGTPVHVESLTPRARQQQQHQQQPNCLAAWVQSPMAASGGGCASWATARNAFLRSPAAQSPGGRSPHADGAASPFLPIPGMVAGCSPRFAAARSPTPVKDTGLSSTPAGRFWQGTPPKSPLAALPPPAPTLLERKQRRARTEYPPSGALCDMR